MQNTSTANSLSQTSNFLRTTFSWVGKSPIGYWSNRHADIYAQASSHDLSHIGAFTLNKDIEHLSGEQQVKKLLAIPYDDIPGDKNRSYAEAFASIKRSFALPDLRAAEYMYANRQSIRSENRQLFEHIEAYLDEKKLIAAAIIFAGSTIRSNVGLTDFPCLYWNGVDKCLGINHDGRYMGSHIHEEDIFLVISD